MKIAILTPYFYPGHKAGGPIPGILGVISTLGDANAHVLTSDRDLADVEPYPAPYQGTTSVDGVEVSYLPSLGKATLPRWKEAFRVMRAADGNYLNSLHSKNFGVLAVLGLAVRRYKGGVVISPRGELAPSALALGASGQKRAWISFIKLFKLDRGIGRKNNVVWLASSAGESRDISASFPSATVLLSPERLRPANASSRTEWSGEGVFSIVSIGRIAPVKGSIDLLRGLKHVTHPVRVDFLGVAEDAEYGAELRRIAADLPANVTVVWSGAVTPEVVASKLAEAHLSVSLTHGENFGHAIGESLQAGCPVLISDQTPWSHVAPNGAGVVLSAADCQDPEVVGASINSLASSSTEDWRQMSDEARKCGEAGLQIPGSVTLLEAFAVADSKA